MLHPGPSRRAISNPETNPTLCPSKCLVKSNESLVVTHFDVAPPFRAAHAGLKPGATKPKCVTTKSLPIPEGYGLLLKSLGQIEFAWEGPGRVHVILAVRRQPSLPWVEGNANHRCRIGGRKLFPGFPAASCQVKFEDL